MTDVETYLLRLSLEKLTKEELICTLLIVWGEE